MFQGQVASYNAERPLGTSGANPRRPFDTAHPLYLAMQELARLRQSQPALHQGRQLVRASADKPGVFAVSRIDPLTGSEVLVGFNTSTAPLDLPVQVDYDSLHFKALHGRCAPSAAAPGSYRLQIPPLDFVICAAVDAK